MQILFLCIKIFLVRILDVSLGTFRTILTVKDKTLIASLVGFIEVLVWFLIVREALNTEINSLWIAISYSSGFATGTFIGGYLSKLFITSSLSVQIITDNPNNLITSIRKEGYAVSVLDIKGQDETIGKKMLFIEINNRNFTHLQKIVKNLDHDAFIVVNETKYVQNGFIK